jgi:hypothetical protein
MWRPFPVILHPQKRLCRSLLFAPVNPLLQLLQRLKLVARGAQCGGIDSSDLCLDRARRRKGLWSENLRVGGVETTNAGRGMDRSDGRKEKIR